MNARYLGVRPSRPQARRDAATVLHALLGRRQPREDRRRPRGGALEGQHQALRGGRHVQSPLRLAQRLLDARGRHFVVWFDGTQVLDATDETFSAPGRVGMWTKAD